MTYEEHRNKGYVRRIMEEIWNDYEEIIDGAYVIAEISDGEAFLHNVFSSTLSNLEPVFELLGSEIKKVSLGFTPLCPENYQRKELQVEDCTFFIRGKDLKCIEEEGLRIPSLAHA